MIRALWSRVKRWLADNSNDRAACSRASIRSQGGKAAVAIPGPLSTATEPLIAAPLAPEWETEDQGNLARFLDSGTGRKFLARFRAVEFNQATAACQDTFHTQHSAGRAAGFSDALKWVISLSRTARVSAASSPDRTPDQHDQEEAPELNTQALGEAQLREQFSP